MGSVMGWSLVGFLLMTGAEVAREYESPELVRRWLALGAVVCFLIALGLHTGALPDE